MLALFVNLVAVLATVMGGIGAASRSRALAFILLVVAVGVAAVTSQAAHGTVWESPLSDLVWWFDALMLVETILACCSPSPWACPAASSGSGQFSSLASAGSDHP